jgi:6-phosphogluconolactonase
MFMLIPVKSSAEDPFFVFAPAQNEKQVIQLMVNTDDGVGSITEVSKVNLSFEPKGMVYNSHRKQLIVTSANREIGEAATISMLADGKMDSVIESSKLDHPSGYVSIDRGGRFFLTSNYRLGVVASYRIKDNGGIGKLACAVKTPNKEAHCVLTTIDNSHVYIPCVKNSNALFQFTFDKESGKLTALEPFNANPPAMFGPRHVAYHSSLPIAYFSNEQQIGISVYRIGPDGQLDDVQHVSTLPRRSPFKKGTRDLNASDLAISADNKRLFVAVRDFTGDEDCIFTFASDKDGKLSLIARSKVGDLPWKIDVSPGGEFLLVSHVADQNLTLYKITEDGQLEQAAVYDWNLAVRAMAIAK